MLNPFKFGGVVEKNAFCNRVSELSDLNTYISNCNKVFLYSERRFGKTSLVKKTLAQLDPKNYMHTYVDLWTTRSELEYINRFATAMAKSFATLQQKTGDAIGDFFSTLKPVITYQPDGSVQFTVNPNKSFSEQTLEKVFSLPQEIAEKRKKKVVVVLDEIQEILTYGSDAVERFLRSSIQNQPDVAYVFLGSRKHLMQEMTLTETRPLYRAGVHYALPAIEQKHWHPFIIDKFNSNGRKLISPELIDTLLLQSDNQPQYTQQLCFELWELTPEHGAATDDLLKNAISKILKQEHEAHAATWRSLSKPAQKALLQICTENKCDSEEQIAGLLQSEIIDFDSEDAPYVVDRILRLWILANK